MNPPPYTHTNTHKHTHKKYCVVWKKIPKPKATQTNLTQPFSKKKKTFISNTSWIKLVITWRLSGEASWVSWILRNGVVRVIPGMENRYIWQVFLQAFGVYPTDRFTPPARGMFPFFYFLLFSFLYLSHSPSPQIRFLFISHLRKLKLKYKVDSSLTELSACSVSKLSHQEGNVLLSNFSQTTRSTDRQADSGRPTQPFTECNTEFVFVHCAPPASLRYGAKAANTLTVHHHQRFHNALNLGHGSMFHILPQHHRGSYFGK